MKDGTTHLGFKPEHAVDLQTGAIVAVELHHADQGDTTTIMGTLAKASAVLEAVREDATVQANTSKLETKEVVADKGYHGGQTLVDLEAVDLRTYVAEPDRGRRHWCTTNTEDAAFKRNEQRVVYNNRRRIRGEKSKRLHRKRGELVERSFEHALDDGGMRRAHLRGRENISKRYLIHIAAFNLGLIMRMILGYGTPKGLADAARKGLRALLRRWLGRMRRVMSTSCAGARRACDRAVALVEVSIRAIAA